MGRLLLSPAVDAVSGARSAKRSPGKARRWW